MSEQNVPHIEALNPSQKRSPLIISPGKSEITTPQKLAAWILANQTELNKKLSDRGAILFRGFGTKNAKEFEQIIRQIEPDLHNVYYGTSPRLAETEYVFTASELPDYYPIMQHCEMSFLADPPRKIFFFCEIAAREGGETPVCDFRQVYADIKPEVKEAFEKKGIQYIRNYNGPENGHGFQLWKLKRWDEMFGTTDKKEVERQCREQGFDFEWGKAGKLRILNRGPVSKKQNEADEIAWFNHSQVFHAAAADFEYRQIRKFRPTLRHLGLSVFVRGMTLVKRIFLDPKSQPMHTVFADGSEIPEKYISHIQEIIWKNMILLPWQKGDVVALDNFTTSHGRMPYRGPRKILVSWSTGEKQPIQNQSVAPKPGA